MMCDGVGELESSWRWMNVWNPHICPMRGKNELGDEIYSRWSYGMRLLEDYYRTPKEQLHIFRCPLYVFVEMSVIHEYQAYHQGKMSPEQVAARREFFTV